MIIKVHPHELELINYETPADIKITALKNE